MASEIAAAPTSSSTIELPNWRAISASRDGAGSRRSSLGPSEDEPLRGLRLAQARAGVDAQRVADLRCESGRARR